MIARGFLSCFVLYCFALSSCEKEREDSPSASGKAPDSAVAQVGERWLLEEDLVLKLEQRKGLSAEQALGELIEEEALAQAAERESLVDPATLRAAQRRLLASRYLEGRQGMEEPTEARLREKWLEEQEKWRVPARARVAVLKLNEEEGVLQRLQEARKTFSELPADPQRRGFGPLAVSSSEEPNTRYQGGEVGWIVAGEDHVLLPKAVTEAVFARKEAGLLATVLSAEGSAWLVLVQEVVPEGVASFASARPQLEREWRSDAERSAKEGAIESAMERVPIHNLRSPGAAAGSVEQGVVVPPLLPQG